MYGIYANIWGILMVNVTIYSIHGSYGIHDNGQLYIEIPTWQLLMKIQLLMVLESARERERGKHIEIL